jgi:hypothetical protein
MPDFVPEKISPKVFLKIDQAKPDKSSIGNLELI